MNGRVYDPFLGRMISADPTVPGPFNSQAFNRYSYVLNNPLLWIDPSGFSPAVGLEGSWGELRADGAGGIEPIGLPRQICSNGSQVQSCGTATTSTSVTFTNPQTGETISAEELAGDIGSISVGGIEAGVSDGTTAQTGGGSGTGVGDSSAGGAGNDADTALEPMQINGTSYRVVIPRNVSLSRPVLVAIQTFANIIQHNIIVTDGNRTCEASGGSGCTGPHYVRMAADIKVDGMTMLELAHLATESGLFTGVGLYMDGWSPMANDPRGTGPHVHVDVRLVYRPQTVPPNGSRFQIQYVRFWGVSSTGQDLSVLPPLPGGGGP